MFSNLQLKKIVLFLKMNGFFVVVELQISWTHALRQIVINCYKFHGREDLLPAFSEDDDKSNVLLQQTVAQTSSHGGGQGQSQHQTVGVVRLSSTGSSKGNCSPPQIIAASPTSLATATQVGVAFVKHKKIFFFFHFCLIFFRELFFSHIWIWHLSNICLFKKILFVFKHIFWNSTFQWKIILLLSLHY